MRLTTTLVCQVEFFKLISGISKPRNYRIWLLLTISYTREKKNTPDASDIEPGFVSSTTVSSLHMLHREFCGKKN